MKTKFSSTYLKQVFGWIEPNMLILFKDNTTGYVKSIENDVITVYCTNTNMTTSILLGSPSSSNIMLYFVKSIDGKEIKDLLV
jgi:hypothetical protein